MTFDTTKKQAGKYLLVGITVALGYLVTASTLNSKFGFTFQGANLVAIIVMHPFSYVGHRYFTFSYAGRWLPTIKRFVLVALLSTTVSIIASRFQFALEVEVITAFLINSILVSFITFLVLKLWVFTNIKSKTSIS